MPCQGSTARSSTPTRRTTTSRTFRVFTEEHRSQICALILENAVSIPHGHHEANVNLLTNKDDIGVVTGMVRYSGIPVSLHPA